MNKLPPYSPRDLISERLPLIFPEGTPNRNYCIRELSASTIFTMLYIGAVGEAHIYLGPVHVYRMTVEQSVLKGSKYRIEYRKTAMSKNTPPQGKRWYADNTREPIRDETLRDGLVRLGAVKSLNTISTTSSSPRYYLQKEFAELFVPTLVGKKLNKAIEDWQKENLSKSARTRISLAGLGKNTHAGQVLVTFPNKETRRLTAGVSSEISRAVIEVFAPNFLISPAVLWLSTSDKKLVFRDVEIADSIGLNIQADKNLPDIILADLGPKDPILIFVEVVATDGAVTERRQEAIYQLTDAAGFDREQVTFLTAYLDRGSQGFKKTMSSLAWNSFAWFVSEPDNLVVFKQRSTYLSRFLDIGMAD